MRLIEREKALAAVEERLYAIAGEDATLPEEWYAGEDAISLPFVVRVSDNEEDRSDA